MLIVLVMEWMKRSCCKEKTGVVVVSEAWWKEYWKEVEEEDRKNQ